MAKKKQQGRTYVSLSFSIPPEGEEPINRRAAELGLSRSQYLWRLAQRDLYEANFFKPEVPGRSAPPRIRRNKNRIPSNGSH